MCRVRRRLLSVRFLKCFGHTLAAEKYLTHFVYAGLSYASRECVCPANPYIVPKFCDLLLRDGIGRIERHWAPSRSR